MTAAGPKRIFILSEPNSGMEDATRAGGRGQGRRRGREELESAAARPGTAAPALPAVRPGRRGVRGASVASLVFLAGPGGSRQGWLNLGWAPNSRRISGSERCRAWLSRVLPLRVLVASGPGAPGDAGSRTCGNPRLGDPAAAFRSDRRCRRSFGVSFTKTLAESPEASILAYPTPRDRRLKGDSSRGWLPCFPRKGYFFFFFPGEEHGENCVHAVSDTRALGEQGSTLYLGRSEGGAGSPKPALPVVHPSRQRRGWGGRGAQGWSVL
jgi:hypothetical protein